MKRFDKYIVLACYLEGSYLLWGHLGLGIALLAFVTGYVLSKS